ncbi:putative Ig domain-containing protein [Caulobacter endophyticus]|nr:putative Ig domain-containing protein [Caulobacter endophyticus]
MATRLRSLLMALFAILMVGAPTLALASPGCDAVNAGAFDQSTTYNAGAVQSTNARETIGSTTYNGIITNNWTGATTASRWYNGGQLYSFTAGETITVNATVNTTSGTLRAALFRGGSSTTVGIQINNLTTSGTFTYTVVSPEYAFDARLLQASSGTGTVSMTASCVVAPPSISNLSPVNGPTSGGTAVSLTGQNFTGATVTIDGATVTPTVHTDTGITFTTPAHAAGLVAVVVTTAGGTASSNFTYVAPPTVTSVSPTAGPTIGGTSVVITGTGFTNASGPGGVKFGATNATTYTVNSDTQITATSPANAAGTYDITVTTVGGTSAASAADQYTYIAAPTVTSVSPTAGPTSGGTSVIITGTGFTTTSGASGVRFGATNATGYTVDSDTQITATSPANSAGTYDITVTTIGGTSATSASDQFTYVNAPTVTSISPTAGPTGGGTTVVITGTNFTGVSAVTFGGTAATGFVFDSATQITATSPAGTGTVDVRVTTPGGTSATSAADQFTFVAPPVSSSPTYGSIIDYNDGGNLTTNIDLSLYITGGGTPTSYAVGSATTAQGGSVSVNSSGIATYTPPVGYRNANDSFTYTATNLGGTSAPGVVTVTIGNPTIMVTLPSPTATVERVYNAGNTPVTLSGGRAPYTVNSISGLPSGLTDAGGGVISGTPAASGTFTVTVNVTDSSLGAGSYNVNTTATLTVGLPPAPVASSFTASAVAYNSGSATGTPISVAGHATESPTSYAVGSATTAGNGSVSIDAAGLVTYTPAVGYRGNDSFTFTASNAGGPSASATVTVPVNNPVFSATLSAPTGTVGVPYSGSITMSGGNAPYSNFSATGLPAGLTMNSSGVISGVPTTATTATVVVTVTDSSSGSGSYTSTASATLTIAAPTITLSPASGALPGGQAGVAYSQTFTSTGGVAPITFAVTAGATPPGLTLSGGGLSGTPTATGTFNFTVTGTDSSGNAYSGSAAYSITVAAPTIIPTTTPLPPGEVGVAYDNDVTATGGNTPYTFALDTGVLPGGVNLNTANGKISGTPTQAGSFPITIRVTDSTAGGVYSATQPYTLVVNAPTISLSSTSLPNATIAQAYSASGAPITATGGTAPYSYTATGLPAGLTINAASGVVSGTPTASGSFNFDVTATDSSAGAGAPFTGTRSYTLVVNAPTIVVSPTNPVLTPVAAGVPVNTQFTAADGVGPYTYSVGAGLPPGVTLSGDSLTGTATAVGAYTFTITAQDSSTGAGPYTGQRTYTLNIGAPVITVSGSLPNGQSGVAYGSHTLTASGGTAPYTFADSGNLPAGLALSPTGTLSGTPTEAGTFNVTISATDSTAGGSFLGSAAFTITIAAPSLSVTTTSLPPMTAGAPYTATLAASGGTAPYQYELTTAPASLPAGLTLAANGQISGTPTASGTFNFSIRAQDSTTGTGAPFFSPAQPFSVTVAGPVLVVSPSALPAATQQAAYSQTITATGGTAPYGFTTIGSLPAGLTLNPTTGELSGTPTVNGTFNFSVRVQDATAGATHFVDQPYSLVVNVPAPPTPGAVSVTVAANSTGNVINPSLSGVPATAVNIVDQPTHGTATVNGMAFDYAPTAGFSGTDTFTYTASNAGGTSAPATVTITVTAPTLVVTGAPGGGTVGVLYTNATFSASTGTVPYTFSGTALPPGLVLNTAGVLSGIPTAGGTFNAVITATDAYGAQGSATFPITIASPTMSLTPTSLPVGDYGVAYSQTFQASGGALPYTYTVAGALPTGVTLNASTGELSGTPTEAGSFPLTVTATDSATGTGPYSTSVNVTLTINQAAPPVADPTSTTTPAGSPTTIDVSNLIDGFYDSVVIVDPPQNGTAVVNSSASRMRSQSGSGTVTITYTPNPGYYGTDSFTYAASGPGGTSSPAAISVAVAAPAPVVVNDAATVNANALVVIPVTANDTGPISTIAVASAPANGTATVSGLDVTYVPTENFFGTDTFTYTATGDGGVSGPATVTVTVNPLAVPTQSAQTLTVLAGQSVTLAATQGATGSPFTGVAVGTAPTKGTAVVNGETIVYTPATGFSGSDSFTYRINNPFGSSAPVPVTVTVNPAPLTAPPITVEILAGQKAVVNLVTGASGGPFTGAAVVSITPANSGAAVVTNPASGAYTLTYTPDNAFAGTAVVTYTLSNAFATSAPGRINVIVKARPDPSQDPEVKGLIAAQDAAAIRFAEAQISNFNRRLEQLHNGGGAGRGFGVSVSGGVTEREDGLEARERFRKYASLGMNDAADPSSPLLPETEAGYTAKDDGEDGQAGPKRWGVWAAGSADFGMRDAVGSQSGFRFTTDGLTGGVDYRVNPDFAFGLGVGYGRDSSRVGKSGTKSKAESYSAGLYASLKTGEKTFIDGVLGYGTLDFDTRRYVTSTGELVNGQRDGDQVFGALTFGMEHRTPTSLLSPYGRVAYSRSQLDAFSETGGGPYGLTYHAQTVQSLTGTLGLRGEFIRKTAAGLLAPRFRVEYSHDFEKANDALLSYTDWVGGPTYRLTVDPIDRDQLRLELGADLTIRNGIRFGLDFDNMVTKDSDSQGVRLSIQSPF